MIIGVVNAQTEATIRLSVRAVDGREQEIEVVLDTGFNGSLTLPPAMIAGLGLWSKLPTLPLLLAWSCCLATTYTYRWWRGQCRHRTIALSSAEIDQPNPYEDPRCQETDSP
jgi:hypothetical protein